MVNNKFCLRALAIVLLGVLLIEPGTTRAGANSSIRAEQFWSSVRENLARLRGVNHGAPESESNLMEGDTGFVGAASLIRGQEDIAVTNVVRKFNEALDNGEITWNTDERRWTLPHDHGRSSVPFNDPVKVIKGPQGFVIIDGHHEFYLAHFLGADTVAVEVLEDLSRLSPLKFWETLKARNLVWLEASAETLALKSPEIETARDNPNRYLASLLSLKVKRTGVASSKVNEAKAALQRPVWIKLNGGVAFVELHIAKVLEDAGITYDPEWGTDVPNEVVEKSRKALHAANRSTKNPILRDLVIIEDPKTAKRAAQDPDLVSEILRVHESRRAGYCQRLFEI